MQNRLKVIRIPLIFLMILSGQMTAANELKDRRAVQGTVVHAFKNDDIKTLEAFAKKFREKESRFSSGVWKLTFYYRGLFNYAHWTTRYPDVAWEQAKQRTEEWMQAHPNSPTPYIVRSILLDNLAYSQVTLTRTGGFSRGNVERFQELMETNRKFLMDNRQVASMDPHWYVCMIRVATAQRWDETRYMKLVEEAVQRYPMYLQIYFAGVDYYSPKFGGNVKQMEKFSRFAVQQTREKLGMAMYARIYWAAIQSWFRKEVWSVIHWDDFKLGVDDVLSRYPDDWNLNNFALFACLKGDAEKANELILKFNSVPMIEVWRSQANFNKCKSAVTTI